jgi:hypothetical protein
MKELILHIGCPKTGSSALQSWLAINQGGLAKQGYQFAVLDSAAKNFKVSSGNGALLDTFIRKTYNLVDDDREKGLAILDLYFSGSKKAIVSSEILSGFSTTNIQKLGHFFDQHKIHVKVIAYVRNLYDFFYSAHVQHVKRTNRLSSFESAVLEERHFRHFLTYKNFSPFFDVTLIHYDAVIDDIAQAFCAAAKLDYAALRPLPAKQVNRTLSYGEIDTVQTLGRWLAQRELPADNFSLKVSDELVHRFPDIESEIVYNERVHEYLTQTFGGQIDAFNKICQRQFDFTLSILSDRQYLVQPDDAPLDRASLERVVGIICNNSASFDKATIEALADKLPAAGDYQDLSVKLRKSLAWWNRFKQWVNRMKLRIHRLYERATNRRMLILKLKRSFGAYR